MKRTFTISLLSSLLLLTLINEGMQGQTITGKASVLGGNYEVYQITGASGPYRWEANCGTIVGWSTMSRVIVHWDCGDCGTQPYIKCTLGSGERDMLTERWTKKQPVTYYNGANVVGSQGGYSEGIRAEYSNFSLFNWHYTGGDFGDGSAGFIGAHAQKFPYCWTNFTNNPAEVNSGMSTGLSCIPSPNPRSVVDGNRRMIDRGSGAACGNPVDTVLFTVRGHRIGTSFGQVHHIPFFIYPITETLEEGETYRAGIIYRSAIYGKSYNKDSPTCDPNDWDKPSNEDIPPLFYMIIPYDPSKPWHQPECYDYSAPTAKDAALYHPYWSDLLSEGTWTYDGLYTDGSGRKIFRAAWIRRLLYLQVPYCTGHVGSGDAWVEEPCAYSGCCGGGNYVPYFIFSMGFEKHTVSEGINYKPCTNSHPEKNGDRWGDYTNVPLDISPLCNNTGWHTFTKTYTPDKDILPNTHAVVILYNNSQDETDNAHDWHYSYAIKDIQLIAPGSYVQLDVTIRGNP